MLFTYKYSQKVNLLAITTTKTQLFRSQGTNSSPHENLTAHQQEWQNAKPYEEIPKNNFFTIFSFLPGGKYYKMDASKLILALKKEFGPITKFEGIFGRNDSVTTHNVEDFATVLRNEGVWPSRPSLRALQYHREVYRKDFFQGAGDLMNSNGEKWANFRSIVNPVLMQPKNVRMYMQKMSQVNKEFIERIRLIRDPHTLEVPTNFEEEINRWTLESVSVVALDKQLGCINQNRDNPMVKHLFESIDGFFKHSLEVEMNPLWKYYKTKSFKNLMTYLDSIMHITNFYINEAIERLDQQQKEGKPEKSESEKSILEKLLQVDRKTAKVMAMDMLMAGVDTTKSAFTGVLLSLAKNPAKQIKLREEVLRILPQKDSEFKEESLKNIPYLRACIKESLRMYPIVLGIGRITVNDVVLSGYRVPKGTEISLISLSLLNDEKHFPRPKEFLPERWLRTEPTEQDYETGNAECTASLKTSSPFVYLPFSFGPRSCVGRRIAQMELEMGVARVIRNFYLEYNYPTENAFKSLLISVPNIPLTFKFSEVEK